MKAKLSKVTLFIASAALPVAAALASAAGFLWR